MRILKILLLFCQCFYFQQKRRALILRLFEVINGKIWNRKWLIWGSKKTMHTT